MSKERRSMTVVSILMLSPPVNIRMTIEFKLSKERQISIANLIIQKWGIIFLFSWLITTRFLIGIQLDKAKSNGVGKLKYLSKARDFTERVKHVMIIEIFRVPVEASKGLTNESEVEIKEDECNVKHYRKNFQRILNLLGH